MIGLLLQIHWLAVNGRTEVLHDLFAFVPDVDVEVWLYQRERKKGEREKRERGGRVWEKEIGERGERDTRKGEQLHVLKLWILDQEIY